MCQGKPGADAGKTAGANRHRDEVERRGRDASFQQHIARHAGEERRLAGPAILSPTGQHLTIAQHGGGASANRRIENQDPGHGRSLAMGAPSEACLKSAASSDARSANAVIAGAGRADSAVSVRTLRGGVLGTDLNVPAGWSGDFPPTALYCWG